MPSDGKETGYLYCRVALVDGLHALQARVMDEEEADEANGDLSAAEAEWQKAALTMDEYFDEFFAEAMTPLAADALARVVGVAGEPIETLAALEARYFPLFHALIRTAYTTGREIREDQAR